MDEVDGAPKGDACLVASESACSPNAGAPPKPDMTSPAACKASLRSLLRGLLDYCGRCRVPRRSGSTRRGEVAMKYTLSGVVVEGEILVLF